MFPGRSVGSRTESGGGKLARVQRLLHALQNERSEVTLDVASLELASIEFPGLELEPSLLRLDEIAAEIEAHMPPGPAALDFIRTANQVLFEEMQFRGNAGEYYDPRNSCLNSVLSRRVGIPITLSVVYMEVARRLDRPVYGVGLPGHFIVAYEDSESRYWIDPFNPGRILSFGDSKIAQNMQSCASPGLYFEVSPTQGIADAMTALFQKAVQSARLTK
jgi:regulator of sirC expression with transglutaminase-like and TPR domain